MTPYQKEHVIKLRDAGKKWREIAEILGVKISTAAKHFYTHANTQDRR